MSTPTTISYGSHTVDFATLPPASLLAMVNRGFAHFLGNEVASKVTAAKAKWAETLAAALAVPESDRTPDHVKAIEEGEMGEAQIEELKMALRNAAVKALVDGTVGVREPGQPKASPLEVEIRKIATGLVREKLIANGLKVPTGDKTLTFPNGAAYTMAQLVDRQIDQKGKEIEATAIKNIAARDRAAKALAATVGGLDDLLA